MSRNLGNSRRYATLEDATDHYGWRCSQTEGHIDAQAGPADITGVWETREFIQNSVEPFPQHRMIIINSQNGNQITGFSRTRGKVQGEIMYFEFTFSGIVEQGQIIFETTQVQRETTVGGASWCSASSQRRIVEGTRMTYQYTRGSDCGTNVGNRGEFTLWKRSSP